MKLLALYWLLTAHFFGDFYLQSPKMAEQKKEKFSVTIQHCVIYALPFLLIELLFWQLIPLSVILLIIVSHAIIDCGKYGIEKKHSFSAPIVFIVDQCLHLAVIFAAVLFFRFPFIAKENFFNTPIFWLVAKSVLFVAVIMKPSNIMFKLLFSKYQYIEPIEEQVKERKLLQKKTPPDTIDGAGAVIGTLERLIMGIFMYLGQFAAVGLVLTAKSITRYNKIATEPSFAEYYLIGTLYSLLFTLAAFLLIF